MPFLARSIKTNKAKAASNTVDPTASPFWEIEIHGRSSVWILSYTVFYYRKLASTTMEVLHLLLSNLRFGPLTLEPPTSIDTTWQSWGCGFCQIDAFNKILRTLGFQANISSNMIIIKQESWNHQSYRLYLHHHPIHPHCHRHHDHHCDARHLPLHSHHYY